MSLHDFIPVFIRQLRLKIKIQKRYGKGNMIYTTKVGDGVSLGGGVYLSYDVDVRDNVTIGTQTYCNRGTTLFKGCQIGNYCSIGYNVAIGPPEHPVSFFSTSPSVYRYEGIKDLCKWPNDDIVGSVIIGNDVWVGSNVVILQGCKIGDGAIVAAGAVVTHDVEPFTIVGGVPAKKIKDRFGPVLKDRLLDSQWWNQDRDWIANFFHNLQIDLTNEKSGS